MVGSNDVLDVCLDFDEPLEFTGFADYIVFSEGLFDSLVVGFPKPGVSGGQLWGTDCDEVRRVVTIR